MCEEMEVDCQYDLPFTDRAAHEVRDGPVDTRYFGSIIDYPEQEYWFIFANSLEMTELPLWSSASKPLSAD